MRPQRGDEVTRSPVHDDAVDQLVATLPRDVGLGEAGAEHIVGVVDQPEIVAQEVARRTPRRRGILVEHDRLLRRDELAPAERSEEHTSDIQSLLRSSYAVFCLQNKNNKT